LVVIVIVIAAGKREDSEVYEAAAARMPKPQPAEKPRLEVVK
jgi:hypothetical protein